MVIEFRKRIDSSTAKSSPASAVVELRPSIRNRPTPVTVTGGAWYHEAAIVEAEPVPPRSH